MNLNALNYYRDLRSQQLRTGASTTMAQHFEVTCPRRFCLTQFELEPYGAAPRCLTANWPRRRRAAGPKRADILAAIGRGFRVPRRR